MIQGVGLAGVVLAVAALMAGYGLRGMWLAALPIAALGLLWLVAWRRGPHSPRQAEWLASLALVGTAALAGVGAAGLGAGLGWMLAALVASLSTWDLHHFRRQMAQAAHVEARADLERRHLQRLFLVDGLGLLIGLVALQVRTRLSLGVLLLLGLVAMFGLNRAVTYLSRRR